MQSIHELHPPLALVERDDHEFMFFRSVEEMLNDCYDVLWGDHYDGWDANGQYFSPVRREVRRRWWHSLFSIDRSYLAIESVLPGHRLAEAEQRIRQMLDTRDSDFAGLLATGVQSPVFGQGLR